MNQKVPTNLPFWIICSAFVFGICISKSLEQLLVYSIVVVCIGIVSLLLFFKKIGTTPYLIITALIFISLGYVRYQISLPKFIKKHIVHKHTTNKAQQLSFEIVQVFKPSENYNKFKIKIHSIDKQQVFGYALLSVKREQIPFELYSGYSFVTFAKMQRLHRSNNPYAFEYSDHLKNQHISHQLWVSLNALKQIPTLAHPIQQVSNDLRKHLEISLKKQGLLPNVYQLTTALVLGNKFALDKQLNYDFVNAGVIHVLAISGLHMGILYILLLGLLQHYFSNQVLKSLLILSCLWLFTWFTGGSPSAVRATTMFSCFEVSRLLMRRQHPINSLFVSVFILILVEPSMLFSVGFQLSIVAVGSIIIGIPKLISLWNPKIWIIKKIWEITCISLCAQIGLLPLSIFYFHQFPGLFLLANIPLMLVIGIVLLSALFMVSFSCFIKVPNFIINPYNYCINTIHQYIHWIAAQNQFTIQNLYINTFSLVSLYIIIAYFIYMCYTYKTAYKWSFYVLFLIVFTVFFEFSQHLFSNQLWILHNYSNTVVADIGTKSIAIYVEKELSESEQKYLISPITGSLHLGYKSQNLMNSYMYKGQSIHFIDSDKSIPKTIKNSVIILINSPKINLDRLLTKHKPLIIVVSPTNYKSLIKKWKATCEKHNVAFYDISQKGSFNFLDLNISP